MKKPVNRGRIKEKKNMINFKGNEGIIFNFRAVAVVIDEGFILLHKSNKDNFWSLPGGRVEFGEKTEEAVIRELREEVNIKGEIVRQLWYVEEFYKYNNENYHEIGAYYLVHIDNKIKEKNVDYKGKDGEKILTYRWFKIDEIKNIELYPEFLKEKLFKLPKTLEKITHIHQEK